MSDNSLIGDGDDILLSDDPNTQTINGNTPFHQDTRHVCSIGVLLLPHLRSNDIPLKSFLYSLRIQDGMVAAEAKSKLGARLSVPEAELASYGLIRVDSDANSSFPKRYLLHTLRDDEALIEDEGEEGVAAGNKGEVSEIL